jgi:hypothetical protein
MFRTAVAAATLALGAAGAAQAEVAYGFYGASSTSTSFNLAAFDTGNVGSITAIGAITGLAQGQVLRSVDFRPANGLLYGLTTNGAGDTAQLYTISLATGAATAVGAAFALTGNTTANVSIDFNPAANALRVVTGSGNSYRVNANTGALIAQDASIAGAPNIAAIAYTNNVAGTTVTTLLAYNWADDTLGRIGGVNGAPSPNGGSYTTIGSTGLLSLSEENTAFDISGFTGQGYVMVDDGITTLDFEPEFFSINLSTGATTLLGNFAAGVFMRDFSIVAAPVSLPATLALALAGLAALSATSRRRNAR